MDMMPVRDGKELIDAIEKPRGVLLPEQMMQEHAHGVETELLGPTQLAIDRGWIERRLLPHLELVDRGTRREVAAHEPAGGIGPCTRSLACPLRAPAQHTNAR